jgi:hypothetical protein
MIDTHSESGTLPIDMVAVNAVHWAFIAVVAYFYQFVSGGSEDQMSTLIRSGVEAAVAGSPLPSDLTLRVMALVLLTFVGLSLAALPFALWRRGGYDWADMGLGLVSLRLPFAGLYLIARETDHNAKLVAGVGAIIYVLLWAPTLFGGVVIAR